MARESLSDDCAPVGRPCAHCDRRQTLGHIPMEQAAILVWTSTFLEPHHTKKALVASLATHQRHIITIRQWKSLEALLAHARFFKTD